MALGEPIPPARRSAAKWIVLLAAWIVGLAVWSVYIGMIVVLIFRWFGTGPGPQPR
jgi:hypothetical protein